MRAPWLAGLAAALLALTGFQHFMVTSQMLSLGRTIDFVSPATQSAARDSFYKLHAMYGGIEVLKLALVLVMTGLLLARRRGRVPSHINVETMDYAR